MVVVVQPPMRAQHTGMPLLTLVSVRKSMMARGESRLLARMLVIFNLAQIHLPYPAGAPHVPERRAVAQTSETQEMVLECQRRWHRRGLDQDTRYAANERWSCSSRMRIQRMAGR